MPVPDRKMQYKAVEIKFEADDTLEIFFAKVHTTSQYISKVVECLKKFDNVFHTPSPRVTRILVPEKYRVM